MNKKNKNLSIIIWLLLAVLLLLILFGLIYRKKDQTLDVSDGIENIDLDTIYLQGSGVEVNFADILLSNHNESRKLIVSTQSATVNTTLTDRLIKKIDYDFMKKTQTVSYEGTGYFVVDLSELSDANIIQSSAHKTVTIKIPHAYLETIAIDPNKVIIDEVKQSLLARGDIELTMADYNIIEKELIARLEEIFNTAENAQRADVVALEQVKEIYEPIVSAIDSQYRVIVEFK